MSHRYRFDPRHLAVIATVFLCLFGATAIVGQEAADADAPKPKDGVFFTLPCHPLVTATNADYQAGRGDPQLRELMRQAILLTAREHFGLITRDPLFEEKLPPDEPASAVDFRAEIHRQKPVKITLFETDEQSFGPYILKGPAGKIEGYYPLTWEAERFSREGAIEALASIGYVPNPTKEAPAEELPKTIQDRLYDMDTITQFYLAQELHAIIRADGQNVQRLAALSHAYSNLAQLTRYRLGYASQGFQARAWLYGCRAAKLYPDRPEGQWAVTYAWMMFDLPGGWHGPLAKAEQLNKEMVEPTPEPAWLQFKKLYWRYDTVGLMKQSQNEGPLAELAAVLAVASAATSEVNAVHRAVLENCRNVNPDTQRGYDTCFAAKAWWLKDDDYAIERYQSMLRAVPRVLIENAKRVPVGVVRQAERIDPDNYRWGEAFYAVAELAWALEDDASNDLPVELPAAALAHLIEEMVAAAALDFYAVASMKENGRQPNARLYGRVIQSLKRHRYAKLFEIFRYSNLGPTRARNEIARKVVLEDINILLSVRLYSVFPDSVAFANLRNEAVWPHFARQFTQNLPAIYRLASINNNAASYKAYSSWLHGGANEATFRAPTHIRYDNINEKQLLERLRYTGHQPDALLAAAEWYKKNNRPEDAYEKLWDAIEMIPDKELMVRTARFALKTGKVDIWQELMIDVRDADPNIPPYKNSEVVIGATYMEDGQWEKALYWIKLAYERRPTGNHENVYLAWCLHETGKTKEAVELLRALDRRFETSFANAFCYQLNLEQTDEVIGSFRDNILPRLERDDPRRRSAHTCHEMIRKGQIKEVIPLLEQAWKDFNVTNDGIRLVSLSRQTGNTELHDRIIQDLIKDRASDYRSVVAAAFARTILNTPDEPPTDEEINAVCRSFRRWSSHTFAELNFGWYLIACGETERGQKWLLNVLAEKRLPMGSAYQRYMAVILLRQSGYDMDNHQWQFPDAHDWPSPEQPAQQD
ncbi:MAG: hypothetical protein AAGB26_17940 [Planctomycetota bacterium]